MKFDFCDICGQAVFFENTQCLSCGHALAFFPDRRDMCALENAGEGLHRRANLIDGPTYRLCTNYSERSVCNWVVDAGDPDPLCLSCRLTRVIPDLNKPAGLEGWYRLETAKRRLVYSLLSLRLPILTKAADETGGLAFEFLADPEPSDAAKAKAEPVLTGHDGGVIVINVAEADDVEREKRRLALGEPYRTLLGHFRHEIGHYYWDRLIAESSWLEPFRKLFGDETADYGEALKCHYQQGPAADWNQKFISAYAGSHPWEDWAETWAHYLHMADSVETARSFGLSLRSNFQVKLPAGSANKSSGGEADSFQDMLTDWFSLTCVVNHLNRGLGLADGYPFVLSDPVIEKLRFIHMVINPPLSPKTDEVPSQRACATSSGSAETPTTVSPGSP